MENNTVKKSGFTVKSALKVLSVVCFVLAFCPNFLVSCSGQSMNVNVMTAVGGVSMYGEKVIKPQPLMLVLLVIPAAIFVLLLIKKYMDKKNARIIAVLGVCDLILWFVFQFAAKSIAEKNYCSFKVTAWYVINIIVQLLIILLSVLVVRQKMEMDSDLMTIFSGDGKQKVLNQMAETMSQMSGAVTKLAGNVENKQTVRKDTIGFCSKCGTPIEYGCRFCSSCGTPVPESMIEEAETARREAEEKAKAEAARREAEAKAREEAARREAEEKAKAEAARREAEARAKEEAVRREAEENASAGVAEKETEETVKAEGQHLFCLECGAKLAPDAKFCASCGAKVE